MIDFEEYLDSVLVPLGVLIFIVYHIFLTRRIVRHPFTTVIGTNHKTRKLWVESIMNHKKDILAIQTLRNQIMASTLLASTSILLASTIATYVTNFSSKLAGLNKFIYGSTSEFTSIFKLLSLIVVYLMSFFCYVQSIRYVNHVCILINVPKDIGGHSELLTSRMVHRVLRRGSNYFTLGNRGYYLSFPLLLWFFGPIPMFVTTFLMVILLWHLDAAVFKINPVGDNMSRSSSSADDINYFNRDPTNKV